MNYNHPIAACLAVLCVLSLAAGPVAADHNSEDFWAGLTEDSADESSLGIAIAKELAAGSSWVARQQASVSDFLSGESDVTAEEYADDFQETFNKNNATLEAYASKRVDATEQYDVYRLEFSDKEGGEATRYVVSTSSTGTFTNSRVVTQSTFDGLNRSIDYTVKADWFVSRNAADELQTFVDEYAEPGKNVTATYYATKKAKYGDGLESDLWGGAS